MSADTQSRAQSSDDDLFIPAQSYNSDDDRFLDALNSEGLSTEETSSKENERNSEDERDQASPINLDSITPSVNATKRKKKKAKKSKKGSKSAKGKSSGKDADLELLDTLIAQNASTTWVESPMKPEVKAKPPAHRKKLKDIFREKREAANSSLAKKLDHAFKTKETQPEKIKKYMDNRSQVFERKDGSKKTMIKVTREALERFKNAATTGSNNIKGYAEIGGLKIPIKTNIYSNHQANVEYLLNKFEDKIANGEMTMDEAIERAYAGQDTDDEEEKLMAGDDPLTKLLNREQMVNLLLEKNDELDEERGPEFAAIKKDMGRLFTNVTTELIEHCLGTDIYLEVMLKLRAFETTMTDSDLNHEAWVSMCKVVYSRFNSKIILCRGLPITQPVKFYEEVLKQYVAQSMINSITDMDRCGVFDRYDPKVRPMAITSFQRHIADLFPKTEVVVEMSKLIENGFAPKDVSKLDIFGTPLVAYGIFWSFAFNFNLFGAFFRANDGGYNYYWVVYDRINEDIDGIVGLPRRIIKETADVDHETMNGPNSINFNREVVSEEGFEEQSKQTVGSSSTLENAMTIDTAAVLNPEFREAYTQEVDKMASEMKISMRYKEVPADFEELKEKLATDDIADISIESKPGEKRRICINFKNGVSEDDKASLVQYIARSARE